MKGFSSFLHIGGSIKVGVQPEPPTDHEIKKALKELEDSLHPEVLAEEKEARERYAAWLADAENQKRDALEKAKWAEIQSQQAAQSERDKQEGLVTQLMYPELTVGSTWRHCKTGYRARILQIGRDEVHTWLLPDCGSWRASVEAFRSSWERL